MKAFTSLSLLLIAVLRADAEPLNNAAPALTNTLAIHIVAGKDFRDDPLTRSNPVNVDSLKLESPPILADSDFVAWNVTNHTFTITPTAAKRVIGRCSYRVVPFVLLSQGERVYLGRFGTSVSSASEAVPVILTDMILIDCFMGGKNIPADVHRMIGRGDPGVTERLMGMTNATTNVTLKIDRGYPSPDGFKSGADRRGDKRVAVAVEKLLSKGTEYFNPVFKKIEEP